MKFVVLWSICKLIFTLSHGKASDERGFTVNKENLQQKSLISQRMMFDCVKVQHVTSLHEYTIPNPLILKCESWRV